MSRLSSANSFWKVISSFLVFTGVLLSAPTSCPCYSSGSSGKSIKQAGIPSGSKHWHGAPANKQKKKKADAPCHGPTPPEPHKSDSHDCFHCVSVSAPKVLVNSGFSDQWFQVSPEKKYQPEIYHITFGSDVNYSDAQIKKPPAAPPIVSGVALFSFLESFRL